MGFLYLPFVYTFHTRLLSFSSKIAWITTYLVPVLLVFLLMGYDFLFYFILISCIYISYEIGYIINDFEVIKNENNPTMRVSSVEISYYEKNKNKIFIFRIFLLVFLFLISYFLFRIYFLSLVSIVFIIFFLYFIYNGIRNNFNLPLYSILVYARYFLFFCLMSKDFYLCAFLFLAYPMCVLIEFSSKKRFFTSNFVKIYNFDKFRVYYYTIVFLIALIFYFNEVRYSPIFLLLISYFLLYRSLSFVFLSRKFRKY